ncbi:MAG: sodium:solute symporter family protein [Euryarchaeota archaeon]|nr:sodium:solute symporter family protein [Euryarchaeota archaeon]
MINSPLFWALTTVYLIVIFYLGYLGYKRTKASEDFMLAGRKVHPWIIGLSYGATFISTSAIVGFGGVSAIYGTGLIWLTMMNIAVGVLLAFIVFGKRTRALGQRLGAVTFPDLLGKRFKSSFMQYSSAILILLSMPLYAAAVMIGGSRFMEAALGIDFLVALIIFAVFTSIYVIFGGLKAVMYTDAVQGAIMLLGMAILLLLTFSLLGGPTAAFTDLAALPSEVPPDMIGGMISKGFTGWTSMPEIGSEYWLVLVTTIIMGVGIGVLAQPQLVVRFMTAKDNKALSRAIPVGGLFIFITTGAAYTIGPLTNLYFWNEVGKISVAAVPNGNADLIMPTYINQAMPELFVVIFMLVLLSAAMSTLSAILHTMGTTAGFDFWRYFRKWRTKSKTLGMPSLRANRAGTLLMLLASFVLALMLDESIIARATAMFMGLCAAAFMPAFVYGLFSKQPSTRAAKASLIVGGLTWFAWTAFVHIKESSILGISQFLLGRPALLGMPWQVVDPMMIALPLSIITLIVVWALERALADEIIANGRSGPTE